MWLTRIASSLLFLSAIILSIPLAFDVGGRACGLAFSLALSTFYALLSLLGLTTPPDSRLRVALANILSGAQVLVLPTLLLWALGRFVADGDDAAVEHTFGGSGVEDVSMTIWLLGPDGLLETATIGGWERFLTYATPVFQLCEGFCSLLVIQTAGQVTRRLVHRGGRTDSWMIGLLVLSASIISMSVYFLWRVMKFPEIGNVDATLIGITITCAVFLCAWGIGSGKGNPVESSLVFAYIVLCVYQIFTDYQPSAPLEYLPPPSSSEAGFPPLPPIIMASYANFILALSTLPSMLHAALNFLLAALGTVTPSVIVSLAYRLFVFHASTRIIPAIRGPGGARLASTADFDADDDDGAGHILSLLSRFSPSILITVYTSLLMQHFATTAGDMPARDWWTSRGADMGGNLWRWVNLAGTMALYVFELYVGEAHLDEMTGHWKED